LLHNPDTHIIFYYYLSTVRLHAANNTSELKKIAFLLTNNLSVIIVLYTKMITPFAIIIMTGEDSVENKLRARQNVIHKVELFQGCPGLYLHLFLN